MQLTPRRRLAALAAAVLLVALVAGGVLWKQRRDRDAACDEAYAELQAAVRTTAFDDSPYEGVDAERRIRQCLEEGWVLSD